MRSRKMLTVIAVLALLVGAACFLGYRKHQERFVVLQDVRYEKTAMTLDLSGKPLGDLELLREFPELSMIDLRDTGMTVEQYLEIREMLPDAQILWDIPFQGNVYPADTAELRLETLRPEDLDTLEFFGELKSVSAENCPDYRVLHELRGRRPELQVSYSIPVAGERYSYDVKHLQLPGADTGSLADVLPYFTELETLELTAPLAPAEDILAMREAFPQIAMSWQLEIGGIAVDEFTETLDLTGIPLTVEEMDAVLPYLLNLRFVDMTDCGIPDEAMDDLNSRYENIKIVWTVTLGKGFRVRTDITCFMPVRDDYYPSGEDLNNLRYCHDIIAIDVGHRGITNCDFAAYMPKLQFLILADTKVRDLTPLTGLKELKYLELFQTNYQDLTPLVTLTSLEDLNLCYTVADVEVVAQITWLKNLWWSQTERRQLTMAQKQLLRDSIPGCNFMFELYRSSTGDGWRDLPNYFAQRDLFGVGYMTG